MQDYDVIVVGAGHAGCEAAHAAARLGLRTALVTLEVEAIARMSCNPSIGGPAKGHLTREVDALGGLQGRVTDATYVNLRLLNTGKGASVQALRAQSDRLAYSREMRRILAATPGISLIEGEVSEIITTPATSSVGATGRSPAMSSSQMEDRATCRSPLPHVTGVRLSDRRELIAPRVVVCPGTFTRAICHLGSRTHRAGRWGETSADALGENLEQLGLMLHRLKTGTSPRIHVSSVDYTACSPQLSEWREDGFGNYAPSMLPAWFLPCWHTSTTAETRAVIDAHKHESAMFSGAISGRGPRYCPSIEDKVYRFPDAERHPVFIEPDGLDVEILYLQGLSTSLPLEAQQAFLATIPGLRRAKIKRPGYAVEYDALNPLELDSTLHSRRIAGLYCAGQFNGTSGYEEAAGQGLAAGANAALSLLNRPPLPLARDNSYIGVMLDDLTTRGTEEPYRMLTARCEHRLLLRHDNAALRLGPLARDAGLLTAEQCATLDALRRKVWVLEAGGAAAGGRSLLAAIVPEPTETRAETPVLRDDLDGFVDRQAQRHVAVEQQYSGYLARARAEVERVAANEQRAIPPDFDYAAVKGLLLATREALTRVRPATLGQAGRVPGVTPADLANLLVALKRAAVGSG